MRHSLSVALALSALALAACGGDKSTGPVSVAGTWSYSASSLVETNAYSCSITGITATIAQSGSTLSGSTTGGTLGCTDTGGNQFSAAVPNFQLSGQLTNNDNVTMDFGDTNFVSTGTVQGGTITGTTNLSVTLVNSQTGAQTVLAVTGAFTATRQ